MNGTVHLDDPDLQFEFARASRCFDLRRRRTPQPYSPPPAELMDEAQLTDQLALISDQQPLSLYFHISFCEFKCTFCDLYCFQPPPGRREEMLSAYTDSLVTEIEQWSRILDLSRRAVTTVHFGGGSPLVLGEERFARLLERLDARLALTAETELAVEITASQITDANLKFMADQGLRRIHVGVQTLDDTLRLLIGRTSRGREVRERLADLITPEFITSVDVLYGLPGQPREKFLDDLESLIDLGVDGFALYELNVTPRMERRLAGRAEYGIDKLVNYGMLLEGKKLLNRRGFMNVFFNHYGGPRDRNLYFTHPGRGEGCLAFGAIADGKLGPLSFRHNKYLSYMRAVQSGRMGLESGYIEDTWRARVSRFESALMSGTVREDERALMAVNFGPSFSGIWDLWLETGLLQPGEHPGDNILTGSGCWLLANMLEQLRRI